MSCLLTRRPRNVERLVLANMGDVYSGYFASLCAQKKSTTARFAHSKKREDALKLEPCKGRKNVPPHVPTADEVRLTKLNLASYRQRRPKDTSPNYRLHL